MPLSRLPAGTGSSQITRRNFINGVLVASAGLAIGRSGPSAAAGEASGDACGDVLGHDPRVLRGGNRPATYTVGHWLRDNRLGFAPGKVVLAPGCDDHQGGFDIADDGGTFDVIVIGAGLSGLSAAFYVLQEHPTAHVLLLEANPVAGGNAAFDQGEPLPVTAGTAGSFCGVPNEILAPLYREIGLEWERYAIPAPMQSYYFDEFTPGAKPGYRGWRNVHALFDGRRKKDGPYPEPTMRDLLRTGEAWNRWAETAGGPDDPPDRSSPRFDHLSRMTLADYLRNELRCGPDVVEFYNNYTVDCMGNTAHYVSAHSAISFLATEHGGRCFAPPGGTAEVAVRLARHLTARSSARRAADIRPGAVALRIDMDTAASRGNVGVTYFQNEAFHRARARTLILATQASSARRLIEHLADYERNAAWAEFNTVPAVTANVAVRSMTALAGLDLGYLNYYWGSRWTNFGIADWSTPRRTDPQRASVLTFYGGITSPPEEVAGERIKLLQTPFEDYENSLRADLSRLLRGTSFDFDRDVSAIFVYRWGHSMILPTTKSIFGDVRLPDGRLDRNKAPRRIARLPLGPIAFAGQHTEGSPSVESAIASGHRAAHEVLVHL